MEWSAGGAGTGSRGLPIRVVFCMGAAMLLFTSGCAVVSAVSTAAVVTVGVISTAVDVGVGAVKVTGRAIGKGIDAATDSGSPAPAAASGTPRPASN